MLSLCGRVSVWIKRCLLISSLSIALIDTVGAVSLVDILLPDLSGMTPGEMAAWFNNPTNVVQSSGEQVALIWQLCSSCRAKIDQSGGDNYGMIYQSSDYAYSYIVQGGNGHQGIIQTSPGIAIIYQAPDTTGNVAKIVQSDGTASIATWH